MLVFQVNTTALLSEMLLRKTSRDTLVQSGIFPTQILWCDKVAACRKEGETRESNSEGRWHTGKGSHTFIFRLYSKVQEKKIKIFAGYLYHNNWNECHVSLNLLWLQ